jgi:predicted acetyltransferase
MSLTHRWTGRTEADLIARVRMLCYADGVNELPSFLAGAHDDVRARDGEFLLVERDGRAVGTATSLHLTMFSRGAVIPCHGVAYVGTIRTERRRAAAASEPGVATVVMQETLRRGRDRGDIVSALMPFRASFYEHFGYGLVERQAAWTLPMSVLPTGDTGSFVPYDADTHLSGLVALRRRVVEAGHCDIDRPEGHWRGLIKRFEEGFVFVDPGRAWALVVTKWVDDIGQVKVIDWGAATPEDFLRLLRMLGSMRDQYASVIITTPVDYPVNRMIKESQVPHRPVAHVTPSVRVYTRMQIRVLDHKKYLEMLRWPMNIRGEAVVCIKESEGHESRYKLQVESGKCVAQASAATATFTCTDKLWASVVTGELSASNAVRFGLASGEGGLLDCLSWGAKPFCSDFF